MRASNDVIVKYPLNSATNLIKYEMRIANSYIDKELKQKITSQAPGTSSITGAYKKLMTFTQVIESTT